jgi:hypothetical protein
MKAEKKLARQTQGQTRRDAGLLSVGQSTAVAQWEREQRTDGNIEVSTALGCCALFVPEQSTIVSKSKGKFLRCSSFPSPSLMHFHSVQCAND